MTGSHRRHTKPRPDLPVDEGWAWLVMLGAGVNSAFGYGFLRSLSIFFPEFLDRFQESATMTTLAFGLNTASYSVFAFLVPCLLLPRFSIRTITLVGALLNAFSIIALSWASSMTYVYVMFVIVGAAAPMIFVSQVVLLGVYFQKRLSFAVAISNLGLSLATMGSPPLTRYLLDEFGLHGALLIHGGLNLHNIAACLLFRPPSFYNNMNNTSTILVDEASSYAEASDNLLISTKDERNDRDEDDCDRHDQTQTPLVGDGKLISKSLHDIHIEELPDGDHVKSSKSKSNSSELLPLHQTGYEQLSTPSITSRIALSQNSLHPSIASIRNRQSSLSKSGYLYASNSSVFMDENGITFPLTVPNDRGQNEGNDKNSCQEGSPFPRSKTAQHKIIITKDDNSCLCPDQTSSSGGNQYCCYSCSSSPSSSSSISVSGLIKKWNLKNSVCCHPLGVMLLVVAGIGVHTQCAAAYMPSLGMEKGLTDSQASLLVTIIGAFDLCKMGIGYFADKGWMRRIHIVLLCQLTNGVLLQFASLFQGFVSMGILCAIFGANTEALHCLLPGIAVDLLGTEFIGQVMSGYFLINGITMSLTHVLVGYLKDETGSFIGGYHFIGGLILFSAVILLLEPVIGKFVPRDLQNQDGSDEDVDANIQSTKQ